MTNGQLKKTAIVAGASGLIGGLLLNNLLAAADNKLSQNQGSKQNVMTYDHILALLRSPLKVTMAGAVAGAGAEVKNSSPFLEQIMVDYSNLDRISNSAEGADLFCALGTTIKKAGSHEAFRAVDFTAVTAFARWGYLKGASRIFLVSSLGADAESRIFYNRVKGEMENEIRQIPFRSTFIFRPSLLMGNRAEFRPLEKMASILSQPFNFAFRGPLEKYRPIHAETVAEAMIIAAQSGRTGFHIIESNQIQKKRF